MKIALFGLGLLLASAGYADTPITPPYSKEAYCDSWRTPEIFRYMTTNSRNLHHMTNDWGALGKGQCWWMARLQRSSLYLTYFRPELPRPDEKQARRIIKSLIRMNAVIEIPGFSDIEAFATEWYSLFDNEIDGWERRDILLRQKWRLAIEPFNVSPEQVKATMDQLYQLVAVEKKLTYVLLIKSEKLFHTHALLFVDMEKTPNGYRAYFFDPNTKDRILGGTYVNGEAFFNRDIREGGVPYIQWQDDLKKVEKAAGRFCGWN